MSEASLQQQDDGTFALSADSIRLAKSVLSADRMGLDWELIEERIAKSADKLKACRAALLAGREALRYRFLSGEDVEPLVRDQARLVDQIVVAGWHTSGSSSGSAGVVAVGGYGRGELHPGSDVDLLILLPEEPDRHLQDAVARFLAWLWDCGLEVGHSTRTVLQCREESEADLTVATTLMESRLLLGNARLLDEMLAAIGPQEIWSSRAFFEAKLREQQARHHRYDDTAYNLEPNIKGSPGGLRDIQMIAWVAKRHFGDGQLQELVNHGLITPGQFRIVRDGRRFLWRIRFALHMLTGRREDRLLFDYQVKIAGLFGYEDASFTLAVEQLMQRYYRTVMELSRINEMVLQQFQEVILLNTTVEPEPINTDFQVRNGFLQASRPDIFKRNPSNLLELFLILQQRNDIKGVSAATISLVRQNLSLIDDEFRQNPRNHRLFLQILKAPEGVTHELRRMNLYGVLGLYIPAFGRIVGRMQYDLFHAYTVDAHTLFVVSNLRRFALTRFDHEFPRASEIMQALPNQEVAYLSGLFHDIAKGRGGDHSELGAVDAESFCLEHGMSRYEARLVAWLVRQHLSLSLTAQKRDINDPEVIREFAEMVGDEDHLDYLYVLTLADVRATNPKLWNSWKARLFEELYGLTKRALRRGLENPVDKDELLTERRESALQLIGNEIPTAEVDALWSTLGEEYFLRCRPEEIAWHTQLLGQADQKHKPLVAVGDELTGGGTPVFLYTPTDQWTFARATAVLDELGLSIADARIIPLENGFGASMYVVLEQNGQLIEDPNRRAEIRDRLTRAMTTEDSRLYQVTRRAPRQVRMFSTPTHVTFDLDETNQRTVMELIASDRPGLLSRVGQVLREHSVSIDTAKIITVGERAEDVFYVSDPEGRPLSQNQCDTILNRLTEALDRPV